MPVVTRDTPSSKGPEATFLAPIPAIATPPSPWLSPDQESPEDHPLESPHDDTSAHTKAFTDRAPGGDPEKVAQVLGGLLVLFVVTLSYLARRRDKEIRVPTPDHRDAIAQPLARIAVRHLPMDALGPDLVDGTEAIVAIHGYVLDGPLVRPAAGPDVDLDVPDFIDDPEGY